MNISSKLLIGVAAVAALSAATASAQVPSVAADESVIGKLHAEGAQIYECKPDSRKSPSGEQALTWQFVEPVATLFIDGKSVGRHGAGPSWDHIDGSGVKGKVIATIRRDLKGYRKRTRGDGSPRQGMLSDATAVLRLDTRRACAGFVCARGRTTQRWLCGGLRIPAGGE